MILMNGLNNLKRNSMLGDIILGIKNFLHQHLFCIHKYKYVYRKDNGADFELCTKCDKIK